MEDSSFENLAERLRRLEQENSRMKIRAFAVLTFFFAALGILAWQLLTPRSVIKAERVVFVNDSGEAVGEIYAGPHGPTLTLVGPDRTTVTLIAGEEGSGLIIEAPNGPDISLLAGNQPYLFLGDAGAEETVLLGLDRGDGPRLHLKGKDRVFSFGSRVGGVPGLSITDGSGKPLWGVP